MDGKDIVTEIPPKISPPLPPRSQAALDAGAHAYSYLAEQGQKLSDPQSRAYSVFSRDFPFTTKLVTELGLGSWLARNLPPATSFISTSSHQHPAAALAAEAALGGNGPFSDLFSKKHQTRYIMGLEPVEESTDPVGYGSDIFNDYIKELSRYPKGRTLAEKAKNKYPRLSPTGERIGLPPIVTLSSAARNKKDFATLRRIKTLLKPYSIYDATNAIYTTDRFLFNKPLSDYIKKVLDPKYPKMRGGARHLRNITDFQSWSYAHLVKQLLYNSLETGTDRLSIPAGKLERRLFYYMKPTSLIEGPYRYRDSVLNTPSPYSPKSFKLAQKVIDYLNKHRLLAEFKLQRPGQPPVFQPPITFDVPLPHRTVREEVALSDLRHALSMPSLGPFDIATNYVKQEDARQETKRRLYRRKLFAEMDKAIRNLSSPKNLRFKTAQDRLQSFVSDIYNSYSTKNSLSLQDKLNIAKLHKARPFFPPEGYPAAVGSQKTIIPILAALDRPAYPILSAMDKLKAFWARMKKQRQEAGASR